MALSTYQLEMLGRAMTNARILARGRECESGAMIQLGKELVDELAVAGVLVIVPASDLARPAK